MHGNAINDAEANLATRYQQNQQRIEAKLVTDITHLQEQLARISPHSREEADVWSLRIYQTVLNRRLHLLRTLFPLAASEAGLN